MLSGGTQRHALPRYQSEKYICQYMLLVHFLYCFKMCKYVIVAPNEQNVLYKRVNAKNSSNDNISTVISLNDVL